MDGVAVITTSPPGTRPHLSRRPARARNGLTGKRNRRTRPCRQAPSSRPPDEPSGQRTHREDEAEGTEGAGMADGNGVASATNGGARRLAFDILFRRLIRHAWSLGPRVVGEILLRLVPDRGALIHELQRYDRFDGRFTRAVGAADWIDRRDLVRRVEP
jgi:hypothetical protein